jgi:hypothetical protein
MSEPKTLLTGLVMGEAPRWHRAGTSAALYAGGHTHTQVLVRHQRALVINPGSVGLPFDSFPPSHTSRNPAWAEYAVVTAESGRTRVDLRRTPFDVAALLRAARASGMPLAAPPPSPWSETPRCRLALYCGDRSTTLYEEWHPGQALGKDDLGGNGRAVGSQIQFYGGALYTSVEFKPV